MTKQKFEKKTQLSFNNLKQSSLSLSSSSPSFNTPNSSHIPLHFKLHSASFFILLILTSSCNSASSPLFRHLSSPLPASKLKLTACTYANLGSSEAMAPSSPSPSPSSATARAQPTSAKIARRRSRWRSKRDTSTRTAQRCMRMKTALGGR